MITAWINALPNFMLGLVFYIFMHERRLKHWIKISITSQRDKSICISVTKWATTPTALFIYFKMQPNWHLHKIQLFEKIPRIFAIQIPLQWIFFLSFLKLLQISVLGIQNIPVFPKLYFSWCKKKFRFCQREHFFFFY